MSRRAAALLLLLAALLLPPATTPARAEVSRFEVSARAAPALEGRRFGERGAAEKITGRATLSLDPALPANGVIADLDRAPRDGDGRVRAVADVVILRPERPNGVLLFELANRGRKLLTGWANDADAAGAIRLERAGDAGNGFLLERGYTLVWAGWQGDLPEAADSVRIDVPVAPGITGPARDEWSFGDAAGPHRVRPSYPLAGRDGAVLAMRARADGERRVLDASSWRLLDDGAVEIQPPPNTPAGALFELAYLARDPRVMGIGLAAVRDVVAFLRHDTGPDNPLAADGRVGITHALGLGISQSGRALRDFLHLGLNRDERGRAVFEGLLPIIPGARGSFTNARFSQPGRNPGPQFDRGFPVGQFPFAYEVSEDPLGGGRDGLLRRCREAGGCPRILQMDSEFEFWGSLASLNVSDGRGAALPVPEEVRLYMLAGAPHGNTPDAVARPGGACAMPLNPVFGGAALRALIVAAERWVVADEAPPASRYPSLADGTLVPAASAYPAGTTALPYRGQYVRAPRVEQPVAIDAPWPRAVGEYPLLLPRAGADGNAVAGLRLPIIAAPRASYTGWNPQRGADGPQDICTQVGGVVPFARDRAAREAAGDARPSLAELYPNPGDYVAAVRAASAALVADRLLLPADAEAAVRAAEAGTLARLGPLSAARP